MDEFLNQEPRDEEIPAEEAAAEMPQPAEPIAQAEEPAEGPATQTSAEESAAPVVQETQAAPEVAPAPVVTPIQKIEYSSLTPAANHKPASRGLKFFAVALALVMLLSVASAAGYYAGRNTLFAAGRHTVKVDLAARPKNTDEMTAAEVYNAANESIVGITVYNTAGNSAQASGVFYTKDGYIITNDHIYAEVPSAKFKIYLADGSERDAEYVAGDQISDLAVLKIKSGTYKAATFGDSDELYNGEHVVAIGRPSGAESNSVITSGIISSTGERVRGTTNYSEKVIQTDSAINPGSSGGALLNMYGQVVGITSSKLAGVNYDAVGYAIPTRKCKRIVDELIKNGKVTNRAKLGITYTAITSVIAEINNYDHVGLYVASVAEDSDLYGKVSEGDIITQINGVDIVSDDIVLDLIEESVAGDKINITVVTEKGAEKRFDAELKANIGESSYSNQASSGNSSQGGASGSGGPDGSGKTFDFPSGE